MKQNKFSKFLAMLPERTEEVTIAKPIDGLDQTHLRLRYMKGDRIVKGYILITKKENGFFIGEGYINLQKSGKNVYAEHKWTNYIVLEGTELRTKSPESLMIQSLFSKLLNAGGIHWADELFSYSNTSTFYNNTWLKNTTILKDILSYKIYNQETLYKAWMKHSFRISVPWRVYRDYMNLEGWRRVSPCVLRDCTTNVANAMKAIIEEKHSYEIVRDICEQACVLDKRIDLNWSESRLENEHTKLTEKIMGLEISDKDQTKIHSEKVDTDNIHLLNTELEVFEEGCKMHHCIYTNYFGKIKDKTYLGFHMSFPEDCTFGVRLYKEKDTPKLELDQIFLKFDKSVSDLTREHAKEFIEQRKDILIHMFNLANDNVYSPF